VGEGNIEVEVQEAGTTFSGYLQQWIGDNQWDKKCILG
jgi:hypothetical protein